MSDRICFAFGLLAASVFWVFAMFVLVRVIEERWRYEDLAASYAFHLFMTRSKWRAYWRTIFR